MCAFPYNVTCANMKILSPTKHIIANYILRVWRKKKKTLGGPTEPLDVLSERNETEVHYCLDFISPFISRELIFNILFF